MQYINYSFSFQKNDITLVHYSGASPNSDGYLSSTVQLLDQYWQRLLLLQIEIKFKTIL